MKPNSEMSQTESLKENPEAGPAIRQSSKLSYMHRPPTIVPNYGSTFKGGVKLKTKMNRVLLYDNVTQQSILNAQISGLQSQRYKTGRQMEMSLKAFLLQKQNKDKALRKLTKVNHAEDYAQFELEYYGFQPKHGVKVLEGGCVKRLTLPCIQKQNVVGVLVRNLPGPIDKYKRSQRFGSNFNNEVERGGPHRTSSHHFSNMEKCSKLPIFPCLISHLPVSLTANERRQSKSVLHLVPQRKLNFRNSFSGNTGIFNNKHNKLELTVSKVAEGKNASRNNHSGSEQVNAATISVEDNEINGQTTLVNTTLVNKENNTISPTDSFVELANVSRSYDGNTKEPVLDHRFELLQKVLVRQDPPNDGFIELSPSFVKRHSVQFVADKSSYLNVEEPQCSVIVRRDSGHEGQSSETVREKSCRNNSLRE